MEKGALGHEPWLRTGPLARVGRPCGHPTPHGPDVTEVPHSPGCLLPRQLGATLSPTPLSPQRFCTKFAKFQHQVEMGGQQVATRQQLAESLLECGHSAAPQGLSDAAGSAVSALRAQGMGLGEGAGQAGPGL